MNGTIVVFDPRAVVSLTGHPDDLAFGYDFVRRFRRLLPERVVRIRRTLRGEDVNAALEAVLSLKVSASTLGAEELCAISALIEGHVRRCDLAAARAAAKDLTSAQRRADAALGAFLEHTP